MTRIFDLNHTEPVCVFCGVTDCIHLDDRPRCKNCGRSAYEHTRETKKCLFEPTSYEPLPPSISRFAEFDSELREPTHRERKEKLHTTRGGTGAVGRLNKESK